jgi:hypothetical protein
MLQKRQKVLARAPSTRDPKQSFGEMLASWARAKRRGDEFRLSATEEEFQSVRLIRSAA